MENKNENYFNETYDIFKKYTDDRLLLLKIQTAKKSAKITSKVVFIFISTIILFFVIMFVGLMLGFYFSEKMNSNFYGFGIIAAIYLSFFILFIILYKTYFSEKIMNMITRVFFENESFNIDEDYE